MNPGQLVTNSEPIKIGGIITVPTGTLGIVQFSDRGVAAVQFVGHILQHNIPIKGLVPMEIIPHQGWYPSDDGFYVRSATPDHRYEGATLTWDDDGHDYGESKPDDPIAERGD